MPKPARSADVEIKICGLHACQAVFRRRPEDIRRLYVARALVPTFGDYLKILADRRVAYHVVDDEELEKITQSVHHGGVAMIVREPPPIGLGGVLAALRSDGPEAPHALLYLDNVQNPHNLGAIVRVAANFGVDGVLVAGEAGASTAMIRTAEGGAEYVPVVPVPLGAAPLQRLREAGFRLLATSSHADGSLYRGPMPARSVILLGSESHGLAPAVLAQADATIAIPGTGDVESLNVATACAVILAEHWRVHRAGGAATSSGRGAAEARGDGPRGPQERGPARGGAGGREERRDGPGRGDRRGPRPGRSERTS